MTQLIFRDHWTIQVKREKESCLYEECSGSKEVSFKRTKHTLSCQITVHVMRAASDGRCRNEDNHENV
jgi:hypothetical protein